MKIAVVGVGNMGGTIVKRMLESKVVKVKDLSLANLDTDALSDYEKKGAFVTKDNKKAVTGAAIVLLCIKPYQAREILDEVREVINKDVLVISIMAGIQMGTLKNLTNKKQPIIRVMPNLCAKVGESVSVWIKSSEVSKDHETSARKILLAIGKEYELEKEDLIDVVTAVAGSGPAYVFYIAEVLTKKLESMGIDASLSDDIVRQMLFGSAKLLRGAMDTPQALRIQVTSKKGTTEAAIKKFEEKKLDEVLISGVESAYKRAKEIAKEGSKK